MASAWAKFGDEDEDIGLSYPCERTYRMARRVSIACNAPGNAHGHVMVASEDGTGVMMFCVRSQAGLRAFLTHAFDAHKVSAVMALTIVRQLPVELTAEERAILESPTKLAELAACGLWSP